MARPPRPGGEERVLDWIERMSEIVSETVNSPRGASRRRAGAAIHGFLTHALAGSTTERVLHHAPCPVLVVGPAQAN